MQKLSVPQIEGLTPAVDIKRTKQPSVIAGRNFLVDVDGPKSAFGFECAFDKFDPAEFPQSFVIGGKILYFTRDVNESSLAISGVDWVNRQVVPELLLHPTDPSRPKLNFPWTHAYVGTYHYFANRTFGVLQYDAINKAWLDVTAVLGIANVFYILQSAGRLICMAEGIISWSAIDDGLDNVPSTTTGAGFQSLSLAGTLEADSDYLGLFTTTTGFIAITEKGTIRATIIDSKLPFRFTPLSSQLKPLTPWTLTHLTNDEIIMLTVQGLYSSADGNFELWQPLFSEFITKQVIRSVDMEESGAIALSYSISNDEFYISFASAALAGVYNIAYVLYMKRGAWGVMNHEHRGFIELDEFNRSTDYKHAFVGLKGEICHLNESVDILTSEPATEFETYVRQLLPPQAVYLNSVALMRDRGVLSTYSKSGLESLTGFIDLRGVSESSRDFHIAPVHTSVLPSHYAYFSFSQSGYVAADVLYANPFRQLPANTSITFRGLFQSYSSAFNFDCSIRDLSSGLHSSAILRLGSGFAQGFGPSQPPIATGDIYNLTYANTPEGKLLVEFSINTGASHYLNSLGVDITDNYGFAAAQILLMDFVDNANPNSDFLGVNTALVAADNPALVALLNPRGKFNNNYTPLTFGFGFKTAKANVSGAFNAGYGILGTVIRSISLSPVNSEVTVGTFQLTDELASDRMSMISNVEISCLSKAQTASDIDWDLATKFSTDVITDLAVNKPSGDTYKDLGSEVVSGSNYAQSLVPTLDGYTPWNAEDATISEVLFEGKTKFCASASTGLYHNLKISALELGQSYHIKMLKFTGILAGRL